jgi:ATP-dependent DNA ligase
LTQKFGDLKAAVLSDCIIDGEIVALNTELRPTLLHTEALSTQRRMILSFFVSICCCR